MKHSESSQAPKNNAAGQSLNVIAKLPGLFRFAIGWSRQGLPGDWQLWRFACKCCGYGKAFDTQLHYGAKVRVDLSDPMCRYPLVFGGMKEPTLLKAIYASLSDGDIFVDVGANFGYYTLLAAEIVGTSGRVLAFEPHPHVAEWLGQNVSLNRFDNVEVYALALGDHTGITDLYTPIGEQSGLATLQPSGRLPDKMRTRRVQVQMNTMDNACTDYLHRITAIKIDAEGYEVPILTGAEQILSSSAAPTVFCETDAESAGKVVSILSRHGYVVHRFDHEALVAVDESVQISGQETLCGLLPGVHEPPLLIV